MRVLITGATGFVGGWLGQELAAAYPDVHIFGMAHHSMPHSEYLPSHTQILMGDLMDPLGMRSLLAKVQPDVVFHLAGFASGAGSDQQRIFHINVDGTVALLQALTERGEPCRVLLASSGYVYGTTQPGRPAIEEDAPAPAGIYAESKAAMEVAIRPIADAGLLSLTITRSFNHTGPRQTPDFVVPGFARQIARIEKKLEEPVVRHGNLEAKRDFLDVRDVVRAYRLLMMETEPVPWRVVNVASGHGVVIRELLEQLIALSSVTVRQESDSARMRPSDMPECIGNPSRLKELTGWEPTIPLTETLTNTLNYWRDISEREP